jgi:hypothetical protein
MLKFRSSLSTGLNAFRSFTTTQAAQEPLSKRVIEKLNSEFDISTRRRRASDLPAPTT